MLQVSFVAIPFGSFRIPGICIVGSTRHDAMECVFSAWRHFELAAPRQPIRVEVTSSLERQIDVRIHFDVRIGSLEIEGVEDGSFGEFLEYFRDFGSFVILAGFDPKELSLIPPGTFNIVLDALSFDGEPVVTKQRRRKIDWRKVFDVISEK